MATETVYTQAQYDGAGRALTQTLAELREVTAERDVLAVQAMAAEAVSGNHGNMAAALAEVGRLSEAVRGMRGSDAILRAQVDGLEKLRDGYAKERDALRTELVWWVNEEREAMMHTALSVRPEGEAGFHADYERARALLGEKDGA